MQSGKIKISVFETSRRGGRFHTVPHDLIAKHNEPDPSEATIQVQSDQRKQRITGFGGSFTDASAFLVHQMSPSQRQRIMEAYFHEDGACYSLTRTHMNSCDFSRFQYSYAPVEGDVDLKHFSIDPDREFLIPMMQAAQRNLERWLSHHRLALDRSTVDEGQQRLGWRAFAPRNAANMGPVFCQVRTSVCRRRPSDLGLYRRK